MSRFLIWLNQIRANFLVLPVLLVLIGVALAYKYNPFGVYFSFMEVSLLMLGVISAHISVNLFNEYSDHRTEIDQHTKRTPFSGGSGMLTQGLTTPRQVLITAIFTISIAAGVGVYFVLTSSILILPLIFIGAIAVIGYTDFFAKYMLGELFSGLALGTLVVLGSYIALIAHTGIDFVAYIPAEVWWLSVPPGILTALLLLLNEFPDVEADKTGGRNHLVVALGKRKAAWIYLGGVLVTFGIILALPLAGISSFWIYLALLPAPIAIKSAIVTLKYYNNHEKIVPALGGNVVTVLATDLLIAVAVFITLV